MKVLVAEDSPTIRAILQYALEEAGYGVITAVDGIEAVEKTYREEPDIIVLDIMMPRMNGYQACRLLKDDPQTAGIPIIMMTTKAEESSRFWGLKTGANDYITKPFEPQELMERLQKIIEETPFPLQVEKSKKEKIIDSTQIISRVNNLLDQELFRSTLINEVGKLASQIQNYPQVIKSILELCSKVVNYQVAGILIVVEEEEKLTVYLQKSLSKKLLSEFEGKIIHLGRTGENQKLSPSSIKREIIGKELSEFNESEERLKTFNPFKLTIGGKLFGILAFASTEELAFPPEDLNLLEFLLPQISIILDSALMHKKTAELAITDGLTRLSTHRYFQECLEREVNRAKRFNFIFSLIILDIDNFKSLNDTYGHLEGDKVLIEISKIMRSCVRETDVVARYGGEEFVVILSETDKKGAVITAERIREGVEKYKFIIGGKRILVTVSIGVSTYPEDAHTKTEIIRQADKALYKAKTSGKNKVWVAEVEE